MSASLLAHLQHGLTRIAKISPRMLESPPTQPRRASVALILHVRPAEEDEAWLRSKWRHGQIKDEDDAYLFPSTMQQDANGTMGVEARLRQFFALPWVQRGTPELLLIKRAVRANDNWSSHVAFPGGRRDEEDENGLYTSMRETWEEVGIDLAEKEFLHVGHLEDREITSSLGKRLLMILSPYIFLHLSPFSPTPSLQPSEVSSLHWVPLSQLFTPTPRWGTLHMDVARHMPQNSYMRSMLSILIGQITFRSIQLPNTPTAITMQMARDHFAHLAKPPPAKEAEEEEDTFLLNAEQQAYLGQVTPRLQLWGLTLGMTLDLLSHMSTYQREKPPPEPPTIYALKSLFSILPSSRLFGDAYSAPAKAPSVVEVFPRFGYPDINLWLWVFGWRYRAILRKWRQSIGTELERQAHWSGLAIAAFYSCVRRALIVALVLRVMGLVSLVSLGGYLGWRRLYRL